MLYAMRRGNRQIVTIQERGVVALPADLRRRYNLKPGDQLAIGEAEDGRLELIPLVAIPASQQWFWTERWQRMEREVDEHIAGGEETTFPDSESFLEHLDQLTRES